MSRARRKEFEVVSRFCKEYDYAGAYWDGCEMTCYVWRSAEGCEDWLEPCASTGLQSSKQKTSWWEIEDSFDNGDIENFSYGYSLNY